MPNTTEENEDHRYVGVKGLERALPAAVLHSPRVQQVRVNPVTDGRYERERRTDRWMDGWTVFGEENGRGKSKFG